MFFIFLLLYTQGSRHMWGRRIRGVFLVINRTPFQCHNCIHNRFSLGLQGSRFTFFLFFNCSICFGLWLCTNWCHWIKACVPLRDTVPRKSNDHESPEFLPVCSETEVMGHGEQRRCVSVSTAKRCVCQCAHVLIFFWIVYTSGVMGNKGAAAVRFCIRGQAVCFLCAHLNAGDHSSNFERRIADIHDIRAKMVFHECLQYVPALLRKQVCLRVSVELACIIDAWFGIFFEYQTRF